MQQNAVYFVYRWLVVRVFCELAYNCTALVRSTTNTHSLKKKRDVQRATYNVQLTTVQRRVDPLETVNAAAASACHD